MRLLSALCGATAFVVVLASPGAAFAADTITDYNLFVLGNMNVSSGDAEGRVAVGGNATIKSYSVGGSASASGTNFVVDGNLDASGGTGKGTTLVHGSAVVTGSNGTFTTTLAPPNTALPIDFAALASYLPQRADQLGALATTGIVGTPWSGQFTVNANSAGLNVFDISAAMLATSNTFTINMISARTC